MRHSENAPEVDAFPIPIRATRQQSGFKGVTLGGNSGNRIWQARAWQGGNSITLAHGTQDPSCIPRLAAIWSAHQLENNPDKYRTLFDEEWLTLWMNGADISTSTTTDDIIRFWGGELPGANRNPMSEWGNTLITFAHHFSTCFVWACILLSFHFAFSFHFILLSLECRLQVPFFTLVSMF